MSFWRTPAGYLPLGRTEVDGDEVFINVMDAHLKPHTGSTPNITGSTPTRRIPTGGEGWGYETAPGTEVNPTSRISAKGQQDAVFGALGEGRGSSSSSR